MKTQKQSYDNTNRRLKAEETKLSIMKALGRLWEQYPLHEITLDMVAGEAEVTKRTILRKFGSKEGLLSESLAHDPAGISAERGQAKVGDVDDILQTLLDNYERMGEAAIRTIHLEPELEIARKIGEQGRAQHRAWCKKVFAPFLPAPEAPGYEVQLVAFIAATEIYLWKLMRKDLKMSKQKTFSVFKNMVEGLISRNA